MRKTLLLLLTLVPLTAWAQCDEATAFNKMMALGKHYQDRIAAAEQETDRQRRDRAMLAARDFLLSYGGGSKLLAEKRYRQACELYDRVAAAHGIDLAATDIVPFQERDSRRLKQRYGCDTAAHLVHDVQALSTQKLKLGVMSREQSRQVSAETARIGSLELSDPGAACRQAEALLRRLQARYGPVAPDLETLRRNP